VPLDPLLLEVLACPIDHGPLRYYAADEVLYNPRTHQRFRVEGSIPVLLPDEAVEVTAAEAAELDRRYEAGEAVETASRPTGRAAGR